MVNHMAHLKDQFDPEREFMVDPDDVGVMLELHRKGKGVKRIAQELGISKNTVKRYVRQGGWRPYGKPERKKKLDGLEGWIAARFFQHGGNAEVIRQELVREKQIEVSLRTIERAVASLRQGLEAEKKATVRFETPPGKQLQIDFGSRKIEIGGQRVTVSLFVATLAYSRRIYVQAFQHERQSSWMAGLEGAFHHFGGIPEEVLIDNPRAMVEVHNPQTREVVFNKRFKAFARYWGFQPRACAPYRARTKGKDESEVPASVRVKGVGIHYS